MVLVKIEPKEAVRFIKLRQSFPHSWDIGGIEEGEEGLRTTRLWVRACVCVYVCVRWRELECIYGNDIK